MSDRSRTLAQAILDDPAVESVSTFIGVDGTNITLNSGRLLIALKPHGTRERSSVVVDRLKARMAHESGIALYLQPVQELTLEDRVSRTQYQYTIEAPTRADLATATSRVMAALAPLKQLVDLNSDFQDEGLQAFVEIDRDNAGRLGVTPAAIDLALYNAFGQRLVSTIYTQSSQYRVVLEVKPDFRRGPVRLDDIFVPGTGGAQIPLSALATVTERPGALSVNHIGQFPASTVSFNLAAGVSLGQAVNGIEKAVAELGLPASVRTVFQGSASAFRASLTSTLLLILAAVVTMYIVLGVLYESYIHPVTILSTLPSAGVGALLSLMIAGHDLGIIAIIGIVLLIGIVKKNAILMVDFALEAERDQGLPPHEAIRKAAMLRFRPILMTTMAALLGALPLMISWGVGSELRRPLGVAMVGGLIFSQMLTIFTTPVIYLYFDRWAARWRRRATVESVPAE
jgi:multidrug efflux pump